jgi:D-glycero-alpha-D-manno-heptose-7-phosphate kinase
MKISQTPYRVSFAGGGTDLPAFYRQEPGAVLSTAIDYHMYINVHRRFEPDFRIAYSRIEIAPDVLSIGHDLVRESLRLAEGTLEPLEITTIGDVPAGTGLGSSSTPTVGLLAALHAHCGRKVGARRLAEEACEVEIDRLDKPIGRQDQYAAAFGGLNYLRFHADDSVGVEPVTCGAERLRELERHGLLLATGGTRRADSILRRQSDATAGLRPVLRQMRDLAARMRDALEGPGTIDAFARLLHEGWWLKRSLGCGISGAAIDALYAQALAAGAWGGKLLGAGGGGFLLVMAPPEHHAAIRAALGHPRELAFRIAPHGSRIIFPAETADARLVGWVSGAQPRATHPTGTHRRDEPFTEEGTHEPA